MKKIPHPLPHLALLTFIVLSATPTHTLFAADNTDPAIRKFDQSTLEKLGVAIYEQDIRAAQATDLLFTKKSKKDLEKEGVRGWIVEGDKTNMTVLFIRQSTLGFEAAYSIKFSANNAPILEVPANRTLTERQQALHSAHALAMKNIKRPCSRAYNLVMLPDPEKDALLVYALAATTDPNEVPFGGHYRFTISKDGKRIEQADALSKSCLTQSKKPKDLPPGAQITALSVSTLLDEKPQEIHVYLSLLHNIPVYVITPNAAMWEVAEGKMRRLNTD